MKTRTCPVKEPFDFVRTLAPIRRGFDDPTTKLDVTNFIRATLTSDGPATLQLERVDGEVIATAWGKGAEAAIEASQWILGSNDEPEELIPKDKIVRELIGRLPGLRLCATRSIVECLVPSIIEQKVNSTAARRSFYGLVRKYGSPAPGPHELMLLPTPKTLAELPYWAFHAFNIEKKRADTIKRACALSARLEQAIDLSPRDAENRLMTVQGVGPWTAAEVVRIAMGDPDAVSVGDYHLPHLVAWTLAGEPRADDARMLELIAPYVGQRGRVIRLIEEAGPRPPRFGPRMPISSITQM